MDAATKEEINIGEELCIKLKRMYYKDTLWVDCHHKISADLTTIKKNAKKFYSLSSTLEALKKIRNVGVEDLDYLLTRN